MSQLSNLDFLSKIMTNIILTVVSYSLHTETVLLSYFFKSIIFAISLRIKI